MDFLKKSLLHSFLKKWHCDFHNILSEYKSLYFVFEAWNKHMWHRNIPYKVILTIIKLTVNIGTKDTLCYRIQFRSGSKKNVSFHAFWITQIMARKNFLYMRWLAKHKIWIKFCNNLLSMCCLTFSFFFFVWLSHIYKGVSCPKGGRIFIIIMLNVYKKYSYIIIIIKYHVDLD